MFKNGGDYMELETKAIHEAGSLVMENLDSYQFMKVLLLNMIQVKKWVCYLI